MCYYAFLVDVSVTLLTLRLCVSLSCLPRQMLERAKAKAAANAAPPPRKWKNAFEVVGRTFKDIVAVDLHPGFTDDSVSVSAARAKANGGSK